MRIYLHHSVTLCIIIMLLVSPALFAQKTKTKNEPEIKIPMEASFWDCDKTKVEFITDHDVKAIRIKNVRGNKIQVRNQNFSSGTIEYDVKFTRGFFGINFRMTPDLKEGENFYVRALGLFTPENRTTLQYTSVTDSVLLWDLTDEYQAGAILYADRWNHIKLVISGKQMRVFVNDMTKPSLVVPELESTSGSGAIFLYGGDVSYANFVLKPNVVEGLSPDAGALLDYNDTRYLRNWLVTAPIDFPQGKTIRYPLPTMTGNLTKLDLPDTTAKWTPINAGFRSIVNLTRVYGGFNDDRRRLVWLKTSVQSSKAQDRVLNLGFSDEVWIFINGQFLRADQNHFGTPGQKTPRGRCTLENASIKIPLKEGNNEILIALSNYFYGWGIVARLDDTDGLQFMKEKK